MPFYWTVSTVKAKAQSEVRASALPWARDEVGRFKAYLRAEMRSENTVKVYGRTLELFFEWFRKPPTELTKADIQAWKGSLAERKLTENTVSTQLAAINQYAERVLERPDMKVRPPRKVFRTKIPLTEDEVRRILEEARRPRAGRGGGFRNNSDMSLRDHAAICLMYYGGLRANEICSLRLSDLDLDDRRVRVNNGKGKDFSPVNLSEEAVKGIREYLDKGRPEPATPDDAELVFLTTTGRRIYRNKLGCIVKRIAFRAGIEKNVHPHIFRHSMITHMAEKNLSASFIQAQSRHKRLDTVQRYTHLSQQSVRLAYDSVFSRQEHAEPEKSAQKQSAPSEKVEISADMLQKLLSMLDRNKVENRQDLTGYA